MCGLVWVLVWVWVWVLVSVVYAWVDARGVGAGGGQCLLISVLLCYQVLWGQVVEKGLDTIILPVTVILNAIMSAVIIFRVPVYRPSLIHAHALVSRSGGLSSFVVQPELILLPCASISPRYFARLCAPCSAAERAL